MRDNRFCFGTIRNILVSLNSLILCRNPWLKIEIFKSSGMYMYIFIYWKKEKSMECEINEDKKWIFLFPWLLFSFPFCLSNWHDNVTKVVSASLVVWLCNANWDEGLVPAPYPETACWRLLLRPFVVCRCLGSFAVIFTILYVFFWISIIMSIAATLHCWAPKSPKCSSASA